MQIRIDWRLRYIAKKSICISIVIVTASNRWNKDSRFRERDIGCDNDIMHTFVYLCTSEMFDNYVVDGCAVCLFIELRTMKTKMLSSRFVRHLADAAQTYNHQFTPRALSALECAM